jgi:hypothetical protein
MLRGASMILLLAAIAGPALALDPSATEETNCLMACDANQQNCAAGHASNHSAAAKPLQTVRQAASFSPRPKQGPRPSGRPE